MDKEREPHLGYRACRAKLDSIAAGLYKQPAVWLKLRVAAGYEQHVGPLGLGQDWARYWPGKPVESQTWLGQQQNPMTLDQKQYYD
ncbi:hypothetical protein Tco_0612738 [Tanacetum coccineum]